MTQLTAETAVAAVNEVLGNKRERWTDVDETAMLLDLDLDSLEVAELFAVLEERCEQDLDPESVESLETVADLARLRPM